jgi:hypothetical protein
MTMAHRPRGLLRHSLLEAESVYRVSWAEGALVELEVVRAPGLDAGTRVLVTRAAARRMRAVPPPTSTGVARRLRAARMRRAATRL